MSEVNPYKMLDLPKVFTLQQLKDNYKRIALKVHPDKGGTEQLFLLVTKCYKVLLEEYNRRQANKEYHELKADFKKANPESRRPTGKFDLEKFNKVFTEHKLQDVYDKGYQDWMTEDTVPKQHVSKLSNKGFTIDSFNSEFERVGIDRKNKYIIKYKEPEPLYASKKIGFTELGQEDVEDFSGDNMTNKNLNFMDYRVAHSTSKIVDPNIINKVKTYKNIQDLERARSQVSFTMDNVTMREYELKHNLEEQREHRRIQAMLERDKAVMEQYEKVNRLMLARR
jgi:curved DNA-binding protein CbpA